MITPFLANISLARKGKSFRISLRKENFQIAMDQDCVSKLDSL
jgi:hypothetical protein